MFAVAQFPLADVRGFVPVGTGSLPVPAWLTPVVGKDFVRAFGQVRSRRLGGMDDWAGEGVYCRADGAFRFDSVPQAQLANSPSSHVALFPVFRRFFSAGGPVCRLEVAFRTRGGGLRWFLDGKGCLDLIERCFATRVKVPADKKTWISGDILSAQRHIARNYLKSTTRQKSGIVAPT